jgi:hypothetical protein
MKFKLLKPRRRRRPHPKPPPPGQFARPARQIEMKRPKANRQASRRQTLFRLACAREITARRTRPAVHSGEPQ